MARSNQLEVGGFIADKYRVSRCIGRGGSSVVVEAMHAHLGQRVAVKLVTAPNNVNQRLDEARTAAALTSEHVVRVVDCGVHDSIPFIVMEHLEGRDLKQYLDEVGAVAMPDAVSMVLQVCEALGEAHTRNIVHTDIKPGNLFCTSRADGSLCMKVLDFGIARPAHGDSSQMIMGSPGYAAPEQLVPNGHMPQTDIWSLGVVLYRLVTGQMPFPATDIEEALFTALTMQPVLEPLNGLPQGFVDAILRCLAKDPEDRFANVGELALALAPYAPISEASYVERTWRVLAARPTDDVVTANDFEDVGSDDEEEEFEVAPAAGPAPIVVSELVSGRPGQGMLSTFLALAMVAAVLLIARTHLPGTKTVGMKTSAAALTARTTPAAPAPVVVAQAPAPAASPILVAMAEPPQPKIVTTTAARGAPAPRARRVKK